MEGCARRRWRLEESQYCRAIAGQRQGYRTGGSEAAPAGASARLLRRFPELAKLQNTTGLPWAAALFLQITPEVISLLDYTKGFGHSETYTV